MPGHWGSPKLRLKNRRCLSSKATFPEEKAIRSRSTREAYYTWTDVLVTIAEDGTEAGREMTEQTEKEEIEAAETGNPVFGRTRGVLSGVVNQFTSGSILVTLVASAAQITGSENLGILLLIAAGALLAFGFWFLVTNVFRVAVRRIFLEGMIYDSVTPQRFTFLLRVKKWLRASWIMFVKYVFYTLWCLTVVGIAVKRYSYYLVPYIVAENPDMTARQAITLSRKMMDGHKWECFKFELSFIGWLLLGYVTMGLVNVFYTNPYKTASFTGYYAELRAQAIEKNIEGAELLNDIYLYEKAGEDVIAAKYSDVIKVMKEPEQELENNRYTYTCQQLRHYNNAPPAGKALRKTAGRVCEDTFADRRCGRAGISCPSLSNT